MDINKKPVSIGFESSFSELAWQEYFRNKTPNGFLLHKNSLLSSVSKNQELTLVHITPNISKIEKCGALYPSGGALGACVYGVPLRADGKLHNLSKYIYEDELPKTLYKRNIKGKVQILAIKIDKQLLRGFSKKITKIDYLSLGEFRMGAYNGCIKKDLITGREQKRLEALVEQGFISSYNLFTLCIDTVVLKRCHFGEFEELFMETLNSTRPLRAVYFETLLEYVILFQNDKKSISYAQIGEVYNGNFKRMIYHLCPELYLNFKLTLFSPKMTEVKKYLSNMAQNKTGVVNFSPYHFERFMILRIAQQIRSKILNFQDKLAGLTFDSINKTHPSFSGHIIHRNINNVHQFESEMAILLWGNWNSDKILLPIYSMIPKGEIGLNPAYNNLKYDIHEAKLHESTDKLILGRKLDVLIVPSIINPTQGIMRAPHKKE